MNKTELFCEKNGKLHTWHTILTGFAFLASSIAWAIYDPYITKILNRLLTESAWITSLSAKLNEAFPILAKFAETQGQDVNIAGGGITLVPLFIGIIMTFDNIFGVIFQPTFGKLSDRCHSKLGKRRPFIVFGAPVSAFLFALIPWVALSNSLPLTMLFIILFVFSMSLWRAPVVALMPDLTPPALRSEGNAVINLMGGLGGAIGMVAGTLAIALCTLFTGATNAQIKANEELSFPYVFAIGAIVMVVGMLVLLFFVKEQDTSIHLKAEANAYADAQAKRKAEKDAKKAEKDARNAVKLTKGERKSLAFMLGTLFFLFMCFAAFSTVIAVFQNLIAFWEDLTDMPKKKIVSIHMVLMLILCLPCALGYNVLADFQPLGPGSGVLDLEDFIVSNNILPLGSMIYVIFCSWKIGWGWDNFMGEANTGNGIKFPNAIRLYIKYILPLIILYVFVMGWKSIIG